MGSDYWFTYVYKSQTAEWIRAAEQERLAAEARGAYRQQQLAARLRHHQVKLTASKPAELTEVASWVSFPTEAIEWIVEDLNWLPTADPMAALLARHRSGMCSAWSARASDRLVGFGALHVRRGGKVAELSHLPVKRHRRAVAIAVESYASWQHMRSLILRWRCCAFRFTPTTRFGLGPTNKPALGRPS